jgi:amino acid adenylation domain-containing protein
MFDRSRSVDPIILDYPKHTSVHALVASIVPECKGQVAIKAGDSQLSYQLLNERANQLANYLERNHSVRGEIIALALDRTCDMVVALLGILKSGAAYLPIDLEYPKERVAFMLEDCGAPLLLTSHKHKESFNHGGIPASRLIYLEDILDAGLDLSTQDPELDTDADEVAFVLYTSGSTGKPKGVMVTHRNMVNLLFSLQTFPGFGSQDRMLAITTIAFDMAAVEIFLPLITGAQIILAGGYARRDGREILELAKKEKVTYIQTSPSTWKLILDGPWNEKLEAKFISAGETLPKDVAERLLPRCQGLYNLYGPTETTVYSTAVQVFGDEPICLGGPVANTQIYLLDDLFQPVSPGEVGEIVIGGDGVSKGYIQREELTAHRFLPDPFSLVPGAKMYRTGDLGMIMEDGNLQFMGRADQQIKFRGHRIEPGEIEYNLIRLGGIKEVVVVLREDRADDQRLVAYVVPEKIPPFPEQAIQGRRWQESLNKNLPAYMVPSAYVFMDRLPRTPTGKTDRKSLPPPEYAAVSGGKRTPVTESECLLADIWKEIMGQQDIGVDEDFFALGGHSLIAVRMMVALEKKTGLRLPMAALFQAPTIEKMGRILDSHEVNPYAKALVPIKPQGSKAPLYIVHGIGLTVMIFHSLAEYMDEDQPVYGIQARGIDGDVTPPENIEEVAREYISEMLEQNPDGPFYLAGYSLGGIIAYEMARQLRALGKRVNMLVLMDTYAGDVAPDVSGAKRMVAKIMRQPKKIAFIFKSLLHQPRITVDYQWYTIRKRFRRYMGMPVLEDWEIEDGPENDWISKPVKQALNKARENYKVVFDFDGDVDLFRVRTRIYFIADPQYLGWGAFAPHRLHIWNLPGDHKTFLEPPNDREVAQQLQVIMNQRMGQ